MKYIFFFIFLQLSIQVTGQERNLLKNTTMFFNHESEIILGERIGEGLISYINGNNVNLRKDSFLSAEIIEKLSLGEEIKILEIYYTHIVQIFGHGESWVKVRSKGGIVGYIYGALISKSHIKYDLNKNGVEELILLGNEFMNPPNGIIKIIENSTLIQVIKIDSLCLDRHCISSQILRIIKDPKLSSIEILEVGSGINSCSTIWRSSYFYMSNYELTKIFDKKTVINNSGYLDQVVFPSDPNGIEGEIIIRKCIPFNKNGEQFHNCSTVKSYNLISKVFREKE